jgi:acetyltransferase-like isoleucine patch superfamily enzyme
VTTADAKTVLPGSSHEAGAPARQRPRIPRLLLRALSYLKREVEAYEVENWKRHFRRCGINVEISPRCSIWGFEGLQIGDNSCIHQFTHIFAGGGVNIGHNVMISANCSISSVTHPLAPIDRWRQPLVMSAVTIADDVWIGMGAVILPGISVGAGSVVAAGAVVTRDVAPNSVVAGNPARGLRTVACR